jgi:hypothetical protein
MELIASASSKFVDTTSVHPKGLRKARQKMWMEEDYTYSSEIRAPGCPMKWLGYTCARTLPLRRRKCSDALISPYLSHVSTRREVVKLGSVLLPGLNGVLMAQSGKLDPFQPERLWSIKTGCCATRPEANIGDQMDSSRERTAPTPT